MIKTTCGLAMLGFYEISEQDGGSDSVFSDDTILTSREASTEIFMN